MIEYDDWLRELAANSDHPFVRDSAKMIQYFFELDEKLPTTYRWRVASSEAFKRQVSKVVSKQVSAKSAIDELNRLYWHDMARNIEAYGILTYWRAAELFMSALRSLNAREILVPAVVSRSLLELGASIIVISNTIRKTVENTFARTHGPVIASITCKELEELVVRMIWGTKIGDFPDYPKPIEAREYREFTSKNPNASEFSSVYKYLCDLTHQGALGYARFWAALESMNEDGSETRKIERHAESIITTEIREKILWALGWSAVCIRNGFEIGQDTVRMILERWPR